MRVGLVSCSAFLGYTLLAKRRAAAWTCFVIGGYLRPTLAEVDCRGELKPTI